MSDKLNIVLNGKNVTGISGETILELAARNGIEIPTLCHDPRLEPYTSCYLCVVEVEGMRGLQPSCSTKISEGMRIETNSGKIFKARKMALDLILSNHYADCTGPCKQTCPAGVDVQGYISFIEKKMYHEAVELIKKTNPFPAVCGRVCVRPCEVACRRNLLNEGTAVGIDYMKRFAADYDLASETKYVPELKPSTGKKVAIIGAGPAGLSAAFFLQKEGHQADIYEASNKAGGWLRYGIPEYRLPNDVLQKEVDNITDLGVKIQYNQKLGQNLNYKALQYKYDAVILAIGSQAGTTIGCEGDDAGNVFSGIDFLKNMELYGERYDFRGKTVAVIGGGNTAMDCCRSSLRCKADKVFVIYRRSEKEMPANPIEIHESKLEGVEYMFLTAPVKVNKDENGNLKSITCIKMGLGEPDASGRRRPVPVPDSEFDVEVDYALAAIGQKTIAEFIDEVNRHTDKGVLKLSKWGDLDANPNTLQTGVDNIFAAGDGVTGPATLIQAIGQAKLAARSCHQFLMGTPVVPQKLEFISKKENFKIQVIEDYSGKYAHQARQEMPTLDPSLRQNFNEVELGYESELVAVNEAQRCLECGCQEYFDCDLKKYATEYEAEQTRFAGDFKEYNVDFRHPFIEIDNNKCILCSRCIRVCREIAGANALGLINRGFKTYVAPSMGLPLQDTTCESCGLCISACPTGALSENVSFKPGPVMLDTIDTICNYCSIGCKITIHHKNGYVMKVTGKNGKINKDSNLCKYPKFGYRYFNDPARITMPLLKKGDSHQEISFEEALNLISSRVQNVNPDQNAFFAGARLTNEEMYLVQKLARAGAKTNNVFSFHYLDRGNGFMDCSSSNTSFDQIKGASKIFLLGSEINMENAVAGFMVSNARMTRGIPVELITDKVESRMAHKVDKVLQVRDYYYFVKSVNHYLLSNNKQNNLFIQGNCSGFEEYKEKILSEDFKDLIHKGVCCEECLVEFAEDFNNQVNAILIFAERNISSDTCTEIFNMAMITGKLGKTANGLISLKEKNNSHGLIDMGIDPAFGPGCVSMSDPDYRQKLSDQWKINDLPRTFHVNPVDALDKGEFKNLFIFGEDPVGCAMDHARVENWMKKAEFVMVQDYFMSDTAIKADLILPSSYHFLSGGSFTNTQKVIQKFEAYPWFGKKEEKPALAQLSELLEKFGYAEYKDVEDVMMEFISLLPDDISSKHRLVYTSGNNKVKFFEYGCDYLVRYAETNLFTEL